MKDNFEKMYQAFRLRFYQDIFKNVKEEDLSESEIICAEIIYLLKRPTVKEFADFINISQPNATYKIKNLIEKGYIKKIPSVKDKRECNLEVTEKFYQRYADENTYGYFIIDILKKRLNEKELQFVENAIDIVVKTIEKEKENEN